MVLVSENWSSPASPLDNLVEWEEVNCLLCGGSHYQIFVESADRLPGNKNLRFAVVRCVDCGLCFTNPRPSPKSIGQFYSENYRPHKPSEKSRSRGKRQRELPRWLVRKYQALALQGEGRLLDFGCGGSLFLEQMRRCGWQVTGIDICAGAVQRLHEEYGLTTLAGTLPHPELQAHSFDVITMWHSLEHVHQPRQVLDAAHELLAPGGKLIVAVPNIDSLPFRWFGSDWYGLDLPRHLIHFAPNTLHDMLESCGFGVGSLRMVRHSSWLRWSARLASHPNKSMWKWLCRGKSSSRLLSWYNYLAGQSDCIMATAVKS